MDFKTPRIRNMTDCQYIILKGNNMMSVLQLKQKFKEIFRGIDMARIDAEDDEFMTVLAGLALNSSKMMTEFQNFLFEEFGYGSKTVFQIIDSMIATTDIKKAFGNKILCLWLKYKIFEVLNLLISF